MADTTLAQLQALVEQQGAELAKLKAAAAATTPAPTEYYTLTKTGEEIDEILAGGGGVNDAVRYGAAQSLSDEQKTQARGNIGAAPGGFGFGERLSSVSATSASELYADYCAKVDAVLAGMPDKTAKLLNAYPPHVYGKAGTTVSILYKGNDKYAVLSNLGSADKMLSGWRMIKDNNAWDPFEWVNPPVELGVEYRTTERYWGKPVYVKLVDCGACPAAGFKDVTFGERGVVVPVRCYGNFGYGGGTTIPFQSTETDAMQIGALINFIRIHTNGNDFSSYNCTATVYYTKTTD